jgi:hypothetical protein
VILELERAGLGVAAISGGRKQDDQSGRGSAQEVVCTSAIKIFLDAQNSYWFLA